MLAHRGSTTARPSKVAQCRLVITEYIIHGTLENLLLLFGTHSELIQMVLLVILGVDVLGIVGTGGSFVHVGVLCCVGNAVGRLRGDLHLAPR